MRSRGAAFAILLLVVLGALLGGALPACGPSPLAEPYERFRSRIETLLDEEFRVWNQLVDLLRDEDPRGVARYRTHLEEKAIPYYARLERDFGALETGHERLVPAKESLVRYAKLRREYAELEVRRLDLASRVATLAAIQAADDDVTTARKEYADSVGDDVPDPRFGEVNSAVQDFLGGAYAKAVEGRMEAGEALAVLRRDFLPRSAALRNGRFDDDVRGRALRRLVITSDEFLRLLADPAGGLPVVVDVLRAKSRIEAVEAEATKERETLQRLLAEIRRDI